MTIRITLPFPDSRLSPNKRLHWASKIKHRRAQGDLACFAAFHHKNALAGTTGYIPLALTFYPPDRRHRDLDNLLASQKREIDMVAKVLGINDRQFRPIILDMGEPDKHNPRTEIEIGGGG